jgi:hypothetical protein
MPPSNLKLNSEDRAPSGIKAILGLESKAQEQLREAQKSREKFELVVNQWNGKVDELVTKKEALQRAAEQIANLRTGQAKSSQIVFENLGSDSPAHSAAAINCAIQHSGIELAFPLLEAGQKRLAEDLQAHITVMRQWGKDNDVPKDVLQSLTEG